MAVTGGAAVPDYEEGTRLRALRLVLTTSALLFPALFLTVALLRLTFPFDLEGMEGELVRHVARLRAGQSIYVAPSLDFIPFIYAPLYYYVAAAASLVSGVTLTTLRTVSLLATLGTMALIARFVLREGGGGLGAVLGVSLFTATYRLTESWFDLARIDSLALFLVLATAYGLRYGRGRGALVATGVGVAAVYFAKQSGLLFLAPVLLFAFWRQPRRTVGTLVLGALLIVGGILWLQQESGGWFLYYTSALPRLHLIHSRDIGRFLPVLIVELVRPLAITFGLVITHALLPPETRRREHAFVPLLVAGFAAFSLLHRLNIGSVQNVMMPAYAAAGVGFGVAVGRLAGRARDAIPAARPLVAALYLVAMLQFAALVYNPLALLPAPGDVVAGRRLIAELAAVEGPIWVTSHGYYAELAGHEGQAHVVAIWDILRADTGPIRQELSDEIGRALVEQRYALIVNDLEGLLTNWERDRYYKPRPNFLEGSRDFYQVVEPGLPSRPDQFFVPRDE